MHTETAPASPVQNGRETPSRHKGLVNAVAAGTVEFESLIRELMPFLSGTDELPSEIALELSTALIELEAETAADDQLYALVNGHGAAALALAKSGQILAVNAGATELFRLSTGDGLSALQISRDDFEQFTQRLSATSGASLVTAHKVDSAGRRTPVVLSGSYSPGYQAFVLKALQNYWPDSVDRALGELFGLSSSERQILASLSRGHSSEQIAEDRFRSIGTVRQQVKSILHKLGVRTQLEAATMAAAAAATSAATAEAAGRNIGPLPAGPHERPLEFGSFLREGRLVGWRRFGDPEGTRVLLLHGPSFGAGEYPEDRHLACEHHLDVHALERPGYGRTHPPLKNEDILDCHINDILAHMDRCGSAPVGILAHEVGLIPALELALRRPELLCCILAVSAAPPFQELEQINAMPEHQAIFIQAARQAPWLARLMIKLLTIRTRRSGVERWTDVIFQGLQPDSRVMKRPALRSGIIATYSFYLGQLGAGYMRDLELMLKDWGHLVSGVETPIVLLHGNRNPSTPLAYMELFRKLNPRVRIEPVENAGLTLAVSHPERIYRRLAELLQMQPTTR